MKMQFKSKLLSVLLVLVMAFALIPMSALTAFALNVTDKVSEVELTLREPYAGENVNLSYSSVEVKHHMTYKVVGLHWYKDGDDRQMGVESGADTYFIGGYTYTVKIDLQVKSGNSGWNIDQFLGHETDYSGIHAIINGEEAVVTHRDLNASIDTICVVYTFNNIDEGVTYPSVTIPTPIAGNTVPNVEDVKVGNTRTMWIPETDYLWYVYENNAWRKMTQGEHYVAGARYKVELAIQTLEGFRFPIETASDLRNDGGMHIWGYINGNKRSMPLKALGAGQDGVMQYDDEIVYVTYEFTSCEAQYVDSVSFSGIQAPSATQHPQYVQPTMTGNYALLTDEEVTGGAQFNFVNGIQWTNSISGLMDENSVFEEGGVYSMSFFIKTFDTHRFTDWVEASANIGYVDVLVMFDDPTIALITITFAPCDGGVLREINVGGIKNPVHGEAPDYEFTYGQGYDLGTSADAIEWYDLTESKKVLSTSTFVYGHKYELRIILRSEKQILGASNGKFEFAPHNELTVKANGIEATKIEKYNGNSEANWLQASIPFGCEKHTIEQVVFTVENPVEGNTPAKQITKSNDAYNIEDFTFADTDTHIALKADDVFVGGKTYFFALALTPAEGYTFKDGVTTAKINGQDAGVIYAGEDSALITLYFTAEELPYYFITFTAGEGVGSMEPIQVKGGTIVLPECEFEAPDGKTFAGWTTDGGMTLLAGEYTVTENVTFEAYYVNDGEHKHVYSDEYTYSDETFHYKTCMDIDNCDDPTGSTISEMHDWGNNTPCDDTCTICGYVRTTFQGSEELHFYEHPCSTTCPNCGLAREAEAHIPGAEATCLNPQVCTVCGIILEEAKGHTPGTEADCGNAQTCTVCNAEITPATGAHTPGAEATCASAQTCTVCGVELAPKTDVHTPGEGATCTQGQTCTVCGEEIAPALGHAYGVEWIIDENGHHKVCACGETGENGEHADNNGDKSCDVCGFDMREGMPGWAITLIVIGSVLVVGVGGFAIFWFVIKKKKFSDLVAVFKKN